MKTSCKQCPKALNLRSVYQRDSGLCSYCFAGWIKAIQRDLRLDKFHEEEELSVFEIFLDLRSELGEEKFKGLIEEF